MFCLSNGRSLGSGGFSPTSSLVNVVVVILIVVVLILCGGVFMLYNQEKGANNDAVAAKLAYGSLNDSYNALSGKYATQVANNADLSERYDLLDAKYRNESLNYASLKNQSETTMVKLGDFLENDPTVAYSYAITAGNGTDNSTALVLKVNVFNVCKADIRSVNIKVTIKSTVDNSTGELVKTIPTIPSLGKSTATWDIDNVTRVQNVWVGLG